MIEQAFAQDGSIGGGAGLASFLPLILIFAVFYFLLIRPQQKQQKLHRQMVKDAKRGDEIVTASGIHGTIEAIDDNVIVIQIADNVRIKMDRNFIQMIKGYKALGAK